MIGVTPFVRHCLRIADLDILPVAIFILRWRSSFIMVAVTVTTAVAVAVAVAVACCGYICIVAFAVVSDATAAVIALSHMRAPVLVVQ